MSTTDFYRAFEERHRGSRELIRRRLEVYLPFIAPLAQLYSPAAAVDLGCGRGEWLELLAREGFAPQGVDLDDGMLAACRERGLPAVRGDAIDYLRTLADESQCVVSGFHIAEHIAFDDLVTLVVEGLRVLKPSGLLILETPNPENIVVGTNSFYLDPTHVRPVPPLLLSFLPEHHGYRRVKTLRLQEAPDLRDDRTKVGLMQVLEGVSPDYSIVAQKAAAPDVLERFDTAFAAPHGIALSELANRHDAVVEHRVATFDQQLAAFDQRLGTAEAHAAGISDALARIAELQDRLLHTTADLAQQQARNRELEGSAQHLQQRIAMLDAQHQARNRELETAAQRMQQQIAALDAERGALRASLSWRVTAPLRWGAELAVDKPPKAMANGRQVVDAAASALQRPLSEAMRIVLRNPVLAYRINQRILRHPALHQRLLGIARRAGVMPGEPVRVAAHEAGMDLGRSSLTPHAREIYDSLERALHKRPTKHP